MVSFPVLHHKIFYKRYFQTKILYTDTIIVKQKLKSLMC